MNLAKKIHLQYVRGIWVRPFPAPVPALKPAAHVLLVSVPRVPGGGVLQPTPPFPVGTLLQTSLRCGQEAEVIRPRPEQTSLCSLPAPGSGAGELWEMASQP